MFLLPHFPCYCCDALCFLWRYRQPRRDKFAYASNYSQDILVNKTQFIIPDLTDETLNMVHNILLEITSVTFEENYENSPLNWKTTHTQDVNF